MFFYFRFLHYRKMFCFFCFCGKCTNTDEARKKRFSNLLQQTRIKAKKKCLLFLVFPLDLPQNVFLFLENLQTQVKQEKSDFRSCFNRDELK